MYEAFVFFHFNFWSAGGDIYQLNFNSESSSQGDVHGTDQLLKKSLPFRVFVSEANATIQTFGTTALDLGDKSKGREVLISTHPLQPFSLSACCSRTHLYLN